MNTKYNHRPPVPCTRKKGGGATSNHTASLMTTPTQCTQDSNGCSKLSTEINGTSSCSEMHHARRTPKHNKSLKLKNCRVKLRDIFSNVGCNDITVNIHDIFSPVTTTEEEQNRCINFARPNISNSIDFNPTVSMNDILIPTRKFPSLLSTCGDGTKMHIFKCKSSSCKLKPNFVPRDQICSS